MRRPGICLFALALVAGCADDGPPGADGARCRVDVEGAGSAVVRCEDGTERPVTAATCTVSPNEDGTATVRCGDAEAIVGGGAIEADGSIVGVARLESAAPGAGIAVAIVGQDRSATTDEAGRFAFEDLPLGIYHLRFAAGGHVPLDLPNVVVFGGATDLGTVVVPRARALVVGPLAPELSPDGRWAAFVQPGPAGLRGDLTLVDLQRLEARVLEREIGSVQWLGGRLLVTTDHLSGVELVLHDPAAGTRRGLPPLQVDRLLSGGIAGYRGDDLVLASFDGDAIELDAGGEGSIRSRADGDRWVAIELGAAVGAWDSETGALHWVPAGGTLGGWSERTGRLALLRDEGDAATLVVFDPATGDEQAIGPAAPDLDRIAFSPDGTVLAWTDGAGVHLVELSTGTRSDPAVPAGDPVFSPGGRFVALGSGWRIDRQAGTVHALDVPYWNLVYAPGERFALGRPPGDLVIVDEEGARVWSAGGTGTLVAFVGERFLLEFGGGALHLVDPTTAPVEVRTIATSAEVWAWSEAAGVVAAGGVDELRLVAIPSGEERILADSTSPFGPPRPAGFTSDGRHLLGTDFAGFLLFDVETGASHRIDPAALEVALGTTGYWCRVPDPTSRHPRAGEPDDPTTLWHWAVYP